MGRPREVGIGISSAKARKFRFEATQRSESDFVLLEMFCKKTDRRLRHMMIMRTEALHFQGRISRAKRDMMLSWEMSQEERK